MSRRRRRKRRPTPYVDVADLVAVLRDMRALSGDPLVVEVCDDAAAVIESMADRLVRQAHELEVAEAKREDA